MRFPVEFTFDYLQELNEELQNMVAPTVRPPNLKNSWKEATEEQRIIIIVNYMNAIFMAEDEKNNEKL